MKVLKKLMVTALVLVMITDLFPARSAEAATKPAKAKVTAKANDDGKSVTLTIAKTKNAEGYKIMVKKPGAKKFTKLATIKEDGTAARTYTAKKLTEGEYQFKVRAYLKNGSKTVWGKYSKVVKVTVSKTASDDKKDDKNDDNTGSGAVAASEFSKAKKGDIITFGAYEQDNDLSNGKEPIEWLVLSNNGDELYVISKYALDCKPYNDKYRAVTWETCTLRKWLNEDFYKEAFSSTEQSVIKITVVKNDDNPEYGTTGGNDTKDKVFLPSVADMVNTDYGFIEAYLDYDNLDKMVNRSCSPTAYAKAKGVWPSEYNNTADGEPSCGWWLRSPGNSADSAVRMAAGGDVSVSGISVDLDAYGVRPALIIKLK